MMFMIPMPEIISAMADTMISTSVSTNAIFFAASRIPVRFSTS